MKSQVKIGEVSLPTNEFVISGTAWLGIKKAGKTYGAKGVAEQLMEQDIPLIVFDAIGTWRHLKVPGDGRNSYGYPIVVAGGESPDVPLTASNAAEIIRAAMRANVSLVIDLYDPKLSKADWRKIVQTGFHTLLYENKKHGPRYVILEEAAEFVPQRVFDGETYASVEKLVRMGGNAGLGIALITPRAQEINKAVLDLCDNLVLMRQRGNAAIDALQKWMDKVSPDIADEIAASLPNISAGQCWVWAENSDLPVKTRTHTIRSFHPDRTQQSDLTKTRAAVDTNAFVTRLLADLPKVVEEKKANDPAELRKRIRELESLLRNQPHEPAEIREVSILTKEDRSKLEDILQLGLPDLQKRMDGIAVQMKESLDWMRQTIRGIEQRVTAARPALQLAHKPSRVAGTIVVHPKGATWKPAQKKDQDPEGFITPTGQRILNAMAELELLKVAQPVREIVALMAGYTNLASTGYVKAISQLRTMCMIDYPSSDTVCMTEQGRLQANFPNAPRSSEEIQQRVCQLIGGKASEILIPLIRAYPNAVPREEVAAEAGYTNLASTGFVKAVSKLRTLGFVDYPSRETMVATSVLFLE